jgi:SAM-dependent methyltransferase
VHFHQADITALNDWPEASADVVLSAMTLHHLPDVTALQRCCVEAARVLKPEGGLYFADFLRLHCTRSMNFFAHRRAGEQPAHFTRDYANSLRAAFTPVQLRRAAEALPPWARLYRARPVGLFGAIKTPRRAAPDPTAREAIRQMRRDLSANGRADLKAITTMLRLGGLRPGEGMTTRP